MKNTFSISPNVCAIYFQGKRYMCIVFGKRGWATFWAIFWQTYLVTLATINVILCCPLFPHQQRYVAGTDQGDQTGRIFAHWAIVYFEQFWENYKSTPNFRLHFSTVRVMHSFWHKIGWATFLATFMATFLATFLLSYLVTLSRTDVAFCFRPAGIGLLLVAQAPKLFLRETFSIRKCFLKGPSSIQHRTCSFCFTLALSSEASLWDLYSQTVELFI
jgi:hypothetical protein